MGPIDDVKGALDWVRLINEDPIDFYNKFVELLKEADLMPKEFSMEEGSEESSGVSKEFMQEFNQMKEELSGLRETVSERQVREENDSQQRQLDNLLSDMHTKLGDFNDDFVVMQLAKGDCTPQEAVDRFSSVVKEFNTRKAPPPNIFIGGSGSIPQAEQVSLSKMPKSEKLAMMVQALESARDQ